ncbi:MAG: alpha/beta hydrolase [Planctomycetota bacterium]|nr:alpha/beta hydrolase [Planctomycetota bacterium]
MRGVLGIWVLACFLPTCMAGEAIDVWPGKAPGETTHSLGQILPFREGEKPPVTRVVKITRPTFTVHLAPKPNGSAVVILPGGGFGKVVPDKEGTEAAAWLNRHGVAAFVVSYRTTEAGTTPGWVKPLQDAQRTLSLVRGQAERWKIDSDRLGLVGFSAGGQVAARLLCGGGERSYAALDRYDRISFRPAFALLIYPWNIYDEKRGALVPEIEVPPDCPPSFLVHTDDDRSSSLGAVLFYAALKRQGIASALHIYGNGGHGYGLRSVKGSQISSWPGHAAHWLRGQIDNSP